MKRTKFKFASKRGASVLIALLVFFLAALSGTIALTMAASNAGTYTHKAEDQQRYLSVASAARLILSRLEGVKVNFTLTDNPKTMQEKHVPPEEVLKEMTVSYENSKEDMFLEDSNFKNYLKRLSIQEFFGTASIQNPIKFSFSVSEAPEMGTTHVEMMANGDKFEFEFWFQGENDAQDYQMTMQVTATYSEEGKTESGWVVTAGGLYEKHLSFITAIGVQDGVTFIVESNVKPQEGG